MDNSRQKIEASYKNLICSFERFSDSIERIDGVNNAFDKIQDSFTKAIDNKVEDAKQELNSSLNETIWDNLVIAFFGVGAVAVMIIKGMRKKGKYE